MSCNEWKEVRLGEIIESISERYKLDSNEVVLINTSDVLEGKVLNHVRVKNNNLKGQFKKSFRKGDILYSEIRPVNKRFAYIDFEPKNYIASTKLMVLRVIDKLADNKFIYHVLKSDDLIRKLQTIAETRSGTFPQITFTEMANLSINLPPINEQKAIAKILSDLDEKIEINNRINKVLEEIAQTIFKRWFVDFEFPNENGEPYKSSGGEMVESELDPIPKGWEVGRLGNSKISRILKTGIEEFKNKKIYIATADVEGTKIKNRSTLITYDIRPSRANMQPKVGTIWFAKMKDSRKLIVVDDFSKDILNNYVFSTGFAGIECFNNSLYYLWCLICNDNFETIKNSLCNGTTMQAINNENIDKINILIPNENTLLIFNNIMKPIYKMIYQFDMQNNYLSQLRDTLLPKLMSGEIRVDLNNGQVILKNNED